MKECVVCGKSQKNNKYDLLACRNCFRGLSINKTDSKKIYGLTDDELTELQCFSYGVAYGGVTYLYFLKDVRMLSIQKKFNIINPDMDTYINCIDLIHKENDDNQVIKENKISAREKNS